MSRIEASRNQVSIQRICHALSFQRSAYYRLKRGASQPRKPRISPRQLSASERETVLAVLHEDRFVDKSPREVYATLLDENTYHCSWRTMSRILAAENESQPRRKQATHPAYAKPELLATAPNQVWSWDITQLRGPVKLTYFYLYVMLDIFSRYVVGWLLADRQNARLAKRFLKETVLNHCPDPTKLSIHSDRGGPMKAQTTAQLLAKLDVTQSFSRPRVSDDNPYSESHFKTVKYCPDFPDRFGGNEHALSFCRTFFPWYNDDHRHSGIGFYTPNMVHYGKANDFSKIRQQTLDAAYANHPERFVKGRPTPIAVPTEVWINKPAEIAGPDPTNVL